MRGVKGRAHDHAAGASEGPMQVGVGEDIEDDHCAIDARGDRDRDAEEVEREELERHAPRDLEDVKAKRRQRTEIRIRVMDAMNAPEQRTRMRGAVHEVRERIEDDQRDDDARRDGQRIDSRRDQNAQRLGERRHDALDRRPEHESVNAARVQQKVDRIRAHRNAMHSTRVY